MVCLTLPGRPAGLPVQKSCLALARSWLMASQFPCPSTKVLLCSPRRVRKLVILWSSSEPPRIPDPSASRTRTTSWLLVSMPTAWMRPLRLPLTPPSVGLSLADRSLRMCLTLTLRPEFSAPKSGTGTVAPPRVTWIGELRFARYLILPLRSPP